MKKTVLLILLLFISACSNKKLNINDIQTINYNNIILLEEEFDILKEEINKLEFKKEKLNLTDSKNLDIISKNKIFRFKISSNSIYYEDNNKYYVSKNINDLNNTLMEIEKRYTDFSFFETKYESCNSISSDLTIKLNSTNKCLVLNTSNPLLNFKIHSLVSINNNLNELDLLYQNNEIDNNKIIIKVPILNIPSIKISFDTKYNYTINIIPIIDSKDNLKLNTSYINKNHTK